MTTVDLTPNYKRLRSRFEMSAKMIADNISRRMKTEGEIDASDVRSLIVHLNIALQTVDTLKGLVEYRKFFSQLASDIADANDAFITDGEVD
jgi:hypothetical protein